MRRARSCRWWCLALAAALSLTCAAPVDAALLTLTPRDREEAVRAGRRSVVDDQWGGEWRVNGGAGELVMVMTPFYRLALAARLSAFQDRELKPRDVESVLKDQEGKLSFWVTLRGGRVDFARHYAPMLVARQQEIKASFAQNERTALRDNDGQFTARCLYVFPAEGVDPKATVTLLVRDVEEKVVAKFTVDLAAMR
ncbi:MAG TPA: hypothetical protein VL086_13950 [Candidatus Nitrosotalea sp.]|nr:hypothetical protein [Candidatus Nitrosotalea sp.]